MAICVINFLIYSHALDPNGIIVLDCKKTSNSYVSYIKSASGELFVVKQKKCRSTFGYSCIIRDCLSAYVAESVNIPTHRVFLISPHCSFPGKRFAKAPATFHTFASGLPIREQSSQYDTIRLQQRWKDKWSYCQKGLTVEVIINMALHNDLPLIVALDTFIGNSDRHKGNLCYDRKIDRFCGIDMDDTFNKNLCKVACDHVRVMLKDKDLVFTQQEIAGLKLYNSTLKKLIDKNQPYKLQKKLDHFMKEAGFVPGNKFYTAIKYKVCHYTMIIKESYQSAKKLVKHVDQLIEQHSTWINRYDKNNNPRISPITCQIWS